MEMGDFLANTIAAGKSGKRLRKKGSIKRWFARVFRSGRVRRKNRGGKLTIIENIWKSHLGPRWGRIAQN
jgi:hypothetical protein